MNAAGDQQGPAAAPSGVTTEEMTGLARAADAATEHMVDDVATLVGMESPSGDVAAIDALAGALADRWRLLGASVRRHPAPGAGTNLEIRWTGPAGTPADAPPALVLGHLDTVHPLGALKRNPLRREGDRLHGPGTQDMKGGLVVAEHAVRLLTTRGAPLPRPVTVLITVDEETGSDSSRGLIEGLAAESAHAFVLEGAAGDGALKTARKGVGLFRLTVRGVAAHAGVHFSEGVNAAVALATAVPQVAALTDLDLGTTVNVGVLRAGTVTNVVPDLAVAGIDVRFTEDTEAARVERALHALRVPAGELTVSGGINRPAMHRTAASGTLFEAARSLAAPIGEDLTETAVGGASDGNFTAAIGTPTLDGLGPLGAGLHTDHEHVDIPSIPRRASLLAGLLATQ